MEIKGKKIVGVTYKQLIPLVKKYAENDEAVLLVGETGSGKEVFANLYMDSSERKGEKVAENCASLPDQLLQSAVFGHVKGAFTDAKENRQGLLRTCNNGILFLDKLGDASPNFQAAILRVAEGHGFRPLGSDNEVQVNTKIIAATNKPMEIREDLKHRFIILPIPPLQKFDIPALAEHFFGKPLKGNILEELMARDYPGNIRDLEKYCEKLRAERGETIFSKSISDSKYEKIEAGTFDYKRFKREFSIWDKYINPILHKYDLKYRYKYFPLPTLAKANVQKEDLTTAQIMARKHGYKTSTPDPAKDISNLIRKLLIGKGEEKILKQFMNLMDSFFNEGTLPLLLENLGRYIGLDEQAQKAKPDLVPLLDLNFKEALKQFEVEYFNYHLRIHNQDRLETAKAIGMVKKTLDSRLRNLRIPSKSEE